MKWILALLLISTGARAQETKDPKTSKGLPPLNKVPKSVYLLKKAKVDGDVGEPLIYPNEQQVRTLYYDSYFRRDRLPTGDFNISRD